MALMKFQEGTVNVNIEYELSKYDFDNAKWTGSRLICSSPFRDDSAPSFFVDLESGGWGDSGADSEDLKSGNFLQLIGKLKGLQPKEVVDYLISEHDVVYSIKEGERITVVKPELTKVSKYDNLGKCSDLIVVSPSPRLNKRGISDETQALFKIGYNEEVKYHTAFSWFTYNGELATVKYRSTTGKSFFYSQTGQPTHLHVYGVHLHDKMSDIVAITEGEIDALSFWEAGIPAVALGGSRFNATQAEIIRTLNVKEVILAGDNDEQGQLLNKFIARQLRGQFLLSEIDYGKHSDGNDVLTNEGKYGIVDIVDNRKPVRLINLK